MHSHPQHQRPRQCVSAFTNWTKHAWTHFSVCFCQLSVICTLRIMLSAFKKGGGCFSIHVSSISNTIFSHLSANSLEKPLQEHIVLNDTVTKSWILLPLSHFFYLFRTVKLYLACHIETTKNIRSFVFVINGQMSWVVSAAVKWKSSVSKFHTFPVETWSYSRIRGMDGSVLSAHWSDICFKSGFIGWEQWDFRQ